MANSSLLPALVLFLIAFFSVLWFVLLLLRRKGQSYGNALSQTKQSRSVPTERRKLVEFLQDDLGQRLAAARVNLSAVRVRMRSDGVPEPDELGTAMKLLDDGC